jgi:hypothetical protein
MSDNLRWFKVWTSITDDPDFLEMTLEDIGRWVLLGAYIGKHGEKGKLRMSEKALCQLLRCDDPNVTIKTIHNVLKQRDISNGKDIVTFKNWHKYQVDNSSERVAKMRQNVTVQEENKKRREKEENIVKEKPIKKQFNQPTLEEVSSYCLERKNGIDPQKWFNHYTSNGWMVGKNKMKDWRASVRTWESNQSNTNTYKESRLSDAYKSL